MTVMRAKTLLAHFPVEHSIPLSTPDHAGEVLHAVFPDNGVAEDYASAKPKRQR